MKKATRVTALLLVLVMLMQTFSFAAQIGEFKDFPLNSWSTEAMTAAVDNGLLIGMGNNKIEPKRNLTRAEMSAIITRAFGATVEKDISAFSDVKENDWYFSSVAKAYNMQVLQGTSGSAFAPGENTTRQEVFLALARVLHIDSAEYSILDKFSDKASIAEWSKNAITGMVDVDYLHGYNDGTLRPTGKITREELAQVFHNIFKTYISAPGEYTSVAPEGSVIIRAPGVTLENVTINGDLVLADGIGNGDCILKNVHVNGRIIVRGGEGTVDFVNVTSTGKVIVNDVNGTVNFHNYRTEAPFADNLLELTPATFLKDYPSSIGDTGGGAPSYDIDFFGLDGRSLLSKPLKIKQNSSIALAGKEVPVYTVPSEYENHSFYGWIAGDTASAQDVFENPDLIMSSADVKDKKVTGKVNYHVIIIDNHTGLLMGGPFGDGLNYHVNPEHTSVTSDALDEHYSTDTQYPAKWSVTENGVTKEFTDSQALADELNSLADNVIVKVEVKEYGNRIKITFKRLGDGNTEDAYAIPGKVLEASRRPQFKNEQDNVYFYTQTGWALNEDGTQPVDLATKTFDAEITIYAVYTKEPIGILVQYFHDENGDGIFDDETELYDIQNYNSDTHNLLKSELPEDPEPSGEFVFFGWATSPENANNKTVIEYPYAMSKAGTNPVKLYAAKTSSIVDVIFKDHATLGTGHENVTIKVSYKTGNILEGSIPTDFVPADEEKQYLFGWKNLSANEEVSKYDLFMLPHIKNYVTTNKTGFTFEAVYRNKAVIKFTLEDKQTVDETKTQYIVPGSLVTPAEYPALSDNTKYVAGWALKGKTEIFDFESVSILDDTIFVPVIKDKTVITYYDFSENQFGDKMYYAPDETVTAPTDTPELLNEHIEEYYFLGWSTQKEQIDLAENKLFKFGEKAGESNINLYPVLGSRIPVDFEFTDTSNVPDKTTVTKYVIPEGYLETDRIPSADGYVYDGYAYTFKYWTVDAVNNGGFEEDEYGNLVGAGAEFKFAETTIDRPNTVFYAVYLKEPVDVIVKFVYDIDKDGNIEDTATADTNGDGKTDDNDKYPDEYDMKNVHTDQLIPTPVNPRIDADHEYTYTFRYWTLDKAKSGTFAADEDGNLIGDVGAEFDFTVALDGSTTLIKLYAVFEKTAVPYTVKFTVDDKDDFRENVEGKLENWTDNEAKTVYGGYVTLPTDAVPVRNGTTFKYWYTKNADNTITKYENVTSLKVEPEVTEEKPIPETEIVLYAYMECKVNFIDEVNDNLGPRNTTLKVQYNKTLESIPDWTRVVNGFERTAEMSDDYATLYPEGYVHEIHYSWFEKDYEGKWTQDGENGWAWSELAEDKAKLVDFDKEAVITTDMNVYLSTRRITGTASFASDRLPDIGVIASVPYETETRLLDSLKDALFINEGYILAAVDESGIEEKTFDKLRNKGVVAENSREILNVNKTINFVSILGKENLNKFIDEQLKKYFQSDEAYKTLEQFIEEYITEGSVDAAAANFKRLLDSMLKEDHDGTLLIIEQAAHKIAEQDIMALEDIIVAYVEACLDPEDTSSSEDDLKEMLDEAFHEYCEEHPDEFRAFLAAVIEDLLVGEHKNDVMKELVIEIAIEKVKAGYFKDRITTEIQAIDDEDLAKIIVEIVGDNIDFVETEITSALDDENFVISMVELLADDPAFKATIKSLAEDTLTTGGNDLKEELKEMFLEDLTADQQEDLIDAYVTNLSDPEKIRQLTLDHIAEISNEQILSYIQGDNPLIVLSASDLLGYIETYHSLIPDATILAKVKEENSPIKVPYDKLLALVKDKTISIPENILLSLVKTEIKGLDDATIASYIKDGTIPVEDSFIESIIISEIEAERDSLVAEAIQEAKDSGDYDTAVQALMTDEGLSENAAKAKVEQEIADEVDDEIDNTIADKTTPEKIAEARANITEEQVNTYRSDIDAKVDELEYSEISSYVEDYIQNKLTVTDIKNNYATLVSQLDQTTFASIKTSVIDALDETTVEENKTTFLSLVTADVVGNVKTEVITNASDEDILKIKESIAGILKADGTIRETVINNYLDDAFASDDLSDNLDTLLADAAGRHLIAVVVADYIESDAGIAAGAKQTLVDEVIGTLEDDIENNDSKMLTKTIERYISDGTRKATLITKAVDMLSTADENDKYLLDDTDSDLYALVVDAIEKLIADDTQRPGIIDDYVDSVVDAQEVDFTEIIDIFCEGTTDEAKAFRKSVIIEFLENLETIADKDNDGVGDGIEIIEEMIDRILEKMTANNSIDLSIVKMTVKYIKDNAGNEHGENLIRTLVDSILEMDDILGFAKDLGYVSVEENLAAIDVFKKQVSTLDQFEVNEHNVFIMGPLRDLMVSLEFDNVLEKYLKPRLPEKVFNNLPVDAIKTIYERSRQNYLDQLDTAIGKAENKEVGYVNSGVTFNFNPVNEIYVPFFDNALKAYEKACGFADNNTGKPGEYYDKYVKDNPYIDDLINLMSPEKLFDEVSADHTYTKTGSGYAIREIDDYYDLIKTAAVLLDDTFLWYLEHVDYEDIDNVLTKHEERVLNYINLIVSLANTYAVDGIPDNIGDIYNDILENAIASGDFEKVVGKVENITNKDVEHYIDKVLANRYPETAYDKVLNKVEARAAVILDLYIESRFNRFVDSDDYDRVTDFLEFAYEDNNGNITVDYAFDKIMDEDNSRTFEFRGNIAKITRLIAPTLSDN